MTEPGETGTLPRIIGPFDLREEIGRGPRGTVFRAKKKGRRLALKLFDGDVGLDFEALERLRRGTPQQIRHPNIAPIEDAGYVDGVPYCTMRVLSGDSLRVVLDDLCSGSTDRPFFSPLSIDQNGERHPDYLSFAVELMIEVGEGLERAHTEGIAHGRLGPDNLIFSPGGLLVMTDFGSDRSAPTSDVLPYRAPEQLEDACDIDRARADVYALGAILYEFAALAPPFGDVDPTDANSKEFADRLPDEATLRDRIRRGKPRPPSKIRKDVPAQLEAIILRAMALDPASRYASGGALAEDLHRFVRGEPVDTPAPHARGGRVVTTGRWSTGSWTVRSIAAAVLLLLTGLVLWFRLDANGLREEADERRSWETVQRAVLTTFNRGQRGEALARARSLALERPEDPRPEELRRQLSEKAAKTHLVRATRAMVSHDIRRATDEIEAASRFVEDDAELETLRREVEGLARIDPVVRDLSDPRDGTRLTALSKLREGLTAGLRSREDVSLAANALRSDRREERELAYAIYEDAKDASGLLVALEIENGGSPCRLDRDTFGRLVEALIRIADAPSRSACAHWSLAAMSRLDGLQTNESIGLAPNLVIEGGPSDRSFVRVWIDMAARLRPEEITDRADELIEHALDEDERLVGDVVDALGRVGSPRAIEKLSSLARERYLVAGCAAIDRLARLDAYEPIHAIVTSNVPLELRASALETLGDTFLDESVVRSELEGILRRNPDAILRATAFRFLSRLDGSDGWDPRPAVLAALLDVELEEEAVDWFARLDSSWRAALAMDLLHDEREELRAHAVAALAADEDTSRFFLLLSRLTDRESRTRRAALDALGQRDDLPRLAREAGDAALSAWTRIGRGVRSPMAASVHSPVEAISNLVGEALEQLTGNALWR